MDKKYIVENSKENVVKVLKAMRSTNCSIFDASEKKDQEILLREIRLLDTVIDLLTRLSRFRMYAEMYPEIWEEEE